MRMKEIIRNKYSKCPNELIKPIYSKISIHAKKIKQINPITKSFIIFNNLNEIYINLGISSKTILNAIENKIVYNGSLWEYK